MEEHENHYNFHNHLNFVNIAPPVGCHSAMIYNVDALN